MEDSKSIDESWKNQAFKEEASPQAAEAAQADFEVNFTNYITSLIWQAMIFLGTLPHPGTQKQEVNLTQAKLLIDTIDLIKEKTRGNLDKEEEAILDRALAELKMKYVELVK